MTNTVFSKHYRPCFQEAPVTGTIVHLPAAPQLVFRTRFSAPPPAKSSCLAAGEALTLLEKRMDEENGQVAMAAITGPGDPLATPANTLEIIRRIKGRYPQLPVGLLTLGMGSSRLAGDLAHSGVEYVEIKVEGVRSSVIEKLFAWIRPGSKTLKLADAADMLLKEQRHGVSALKFHGISVTILTTLYPGCNIDHVSLVSAEMMELGADAISLVPYSSEPQTEVDLEAPSAEEIAGAVLRAGAYLPVVPSLLYRKPQESATCEWQSYQAVPSPTGELPNVAVASSNGIEIDLHLGHAKQFLIYGRRDDGLACLLETRNASEPGSGSGRWRQAAEILKDCRILLTAGIGENPRRILTEKGLKVIVTDENIEGMVDAIYGSGKKNKEK